MAIDGDLMAVGAVRESSCEDGIDPPFGSTTCTDAGAAYIYRRIGGVWTYEAYVKASNSNAHDFFAPVAISGNTLVVGAQGEDSCAKTINGTQSNGCSASGALYVFVHDGSNQWTQQAYIKGSMLSVDSNLGRSVSISGDTIVAGANKENGVRGAAYVFRRSGTTWVEEQRLIASNRGPNDFFGESVWD